MRRIRMEDVARKAGVSVMTVSRALKPGDLVSPKTRQKILKVVKELGYVPDQIAGSLSSQRSGFVAMLVPSLNNPPLAETTHALATTLEAAGLQILIGYTNYEPGREERLIAELLQRRPEAVVVIADGHSPGSRKLLTNAGIPVVHLWDWPSRPIDNVVGFSNEDVGDALVRYLIERGYRKLAYLGEVEDEGTRGARRRQGFVRAVQELNVGPVWVFDYKPPPFNMTSGREAFRLMRERWPDVDAVVCVSDPCAFGVLTEAQAMGLSVPSQLAVVGFGNFEVSRCCTPSLTTVSVDAGRIGREAGTLLADLLRTPTTKEFERSRCRIKVEAVLTPRGTTR
jgi:LacI family transcriptional regulator, gluconate utilization system Gnt-I transcriptional repressor